MDEQVSHVEVPHLERLAVVFSIAAAVIAALLLLVGSIALYVPFGLAFFAFAMWLSLRLMLVGSLFDPLAWFLIYQALFQGLGLLSPIVLPTLPGDYLTMRAPLAEAMPGPVLISHVAGAIVVMLIVAVGRWWPWAPATPEPPLLTTQGMLGSLHRHTAVIFGFALLAIAISWLGMVVPGLPLVRHATLLCQLGLGFVALVFGYNVSRGGPGFRLAVALLLLAAFATSLLTLYKAGPTLIIVAFAGGYLLRNGPSARAILVVVAAILGFFLLVQPVITNARNAAGPHWVQGLSLGERGHALARGLAHAGAFEGGVEQLMRRVTITQYQAFAIDRYDRGEPGDTMSEWYWGLLPRALFPEKPLLSRHSKAIYALYSNRSSGTSSAPVGFVAEGYWNGGLPLALLVCCIYGVQLGILRELLRIGMQQHNVLAVLLGPVIAVYVIATDTLFAMHKVSLFAFLLVLLVGSIILGQLWPAWRRPGRLTAT